MLAERYLNGEYLAQVPDWHAQDAAWKAQKLLQMLRRNRLWPRSVCDVGCGAGGILTELQARLPQSTKLFGFDISPDALRLCAPKGNGRLTFECADLSTRPDLGPWDLLLLLDVMEHVPDYLGLLRALRLRAAYFLFHIPLELTVHAVARRSQPLLEQRRRYGHLHHFSRETALAALNDTGFEVEDVAYTWDKEPDGLLPPRDPGVRGLLRYPARCLVHGLERLAFGARPEVTARVRPSYNLLVLARPSDGR